MNMTELENQLLELHRLRDRHVKRLLTDLDPPPLVERAIKGAFARFRDDVALEVVIRRGENTVVQAARKEKVQDE